MPGDTWIFFRRQRVCAGRERGGGEEGLQRAAALRPLASALPFLPVPRFFVPLPLPVFFDLFLPLEAFPPPRIWLSELRTQVPQWPGQWSNAPVRHCVAVRSSQYAGSASPLQYMIGVASEERDDAAVRPDNAKATNAENTGLWEGRAMVGMGAKAAKAGAA